MIGDSEHSVGICWLCTGVLISP